MSQRARLDIPTERVNPRTTDIDLLPTLELLRLLNSEDRTVPEAVGHALPELAHAVDRAVEALRAGGRVHYVGAGTSGRLAALDAAELVPTFNISPDWFVVHQAGGAQALHRPVENAEDDEDAGAASIRESAGTGDVVLGLAASGRTPFVLGALRAARDLSLRTALVTSNPDSPAHDIAETAVVTATGPEPVAGSTRMKAGTAQKLVLTAFSTATLIRLGYTYSNLMVSLLATNAKLRGRTLSILRETTDASEQECAAALDAAEGDVKTALVHLLADVEVSRAAELLAEHGGHVRHALAAVREE